MRKLLGVFAMALLFPANSLAAEAPAATPAVETLYVRAEPSAALLATPSTTAVVIRELTPGDAVTVLGRQAGFVNVQAADGVQGWLSETSLTGVLPPAVHVAQLEQEIAGLRKELAAVRASLERSEARLRAAQTAAANARESGADTSAALKSENDALQERLAAATAEVSGLKARLEDIETEQQIARDAAELLAARQPPEDSAASARFSNAELAAGLAVALGLAVMGAWFGTASARRRLRRRYHGLEL